MSGGKNKGIPETAQQRELATIGTEWARINDTRFRPLQRNLVRQAMDGTRERRDAASASNVKTQQAFAQARPQVAASQVRSGAAIGSGRFNAAVGGTATDSGLSAGLGLSDAKQAVEGDLASKRQALIDLGVGKVASGSAGLAQAANIAQANAITDARNSAASRAATSGIVGAAAGAAGSYGLDYLRKKPGAGVGKTTATQPANLPVGYGELGWGG